MTKEEIRDMVLDCAREAGITTEMIESGRHTMRENPISPVAATIMAVSDAGITGSQLEAFGRSLSRRGWSFDSLLKEIGGLGPKGRLFQAAFSAFKDAGSS